MNTFVLLGLVVLLVLFLLRSRRRGAGSGDAAPAATRTRGLGRRRGRDPEPARAPQAAAHPPFEPTPFAAAGSAAPFDPAPGPLPAPAYAAPVADPSDWAPADMIVEPGWPLPGEIAGAWSGGPEATAAPVAAIETPVAETAATLAPPEPQAPEADTWEMPALRPVAVAEEQAPEAVDGVAPEAGPAGDEAPAWTPEPEQAPAPDAVVTPPWTADADPEPDWHAEPDDALPVWTPEAAPAEDIWLPAEAPAHTGQAPDADLPAWQPPPADVAGEPAPEPDPAVVAEPLPEPVAATEPDDAPDDQAAPLWEPAPVVAVAPPAAPVPVVMPEPVLDPLPAMEDLVLAAEPAQVSADEIAALLAPALAAVRPLVRVSDHAGVTPRMLVVMRALCERPLSVGEQATLLGVSRPVVADIAARLEGLGLTRRERDERDRRRVRMALTDRGRRVCAEAAETPPADAVATALAVLGDDDRAALLRGLRALAGGAPA